MGDEVLGKRSKEEELFSKQVVKFFRSQVTRSQFRLTVRVDEKAKILKDITIGKDRDKCWKLIAGFQQQDIVFYDPTQSFKMDDFASNITRIDKYDKSGQKPVVIPYVVCELKIGSKTNTHSLITYASISTQLKSIFPHCAYYFVMDSNQERGMKPETVLRHSKGFDRVFLNWDKEKGKVWEAICAHLSYLKEIELMS